MIKYKLYCETCSNTFDSWFANSKEYEKIRKLKYLSCNKCNSTNVHKSLMAPNLFNTKKKNKIKIANNDKFINVKNKIKEYQKFIKKNFKYVGDNFAYEAISIHYENADDKKNNKGIYGNASFEEVKELQDEGIKTETIPWIKEDEN